MLTCSSSGISSFTLKREAANYTASPPRRHITIVSLLELLSQANSHITNVQVEQGVTRDKTKPI
jgi:hypothetical protein